MRGVTLSHARLHGAILTIICGMGAFLTSGTEEQSNTCTTPHLSLTGSRFVTIREGEELSLNCTLTSPASQDVTKFWYLQFKNITDPIDTTTVPYHYPEITFEHVTDRNPTFSLTIRGLTARLEHVMVQCTVQKGVEPERFSKGMFMIHILPSVTTDAADDPSTGPADDPSTGPADDPSTTGPQSEVDCRTTSAQGRGPATKPQSNITNQPLPSVKDSLLEMTLLTTAMCACLIVNTVTLLMVVIVLCRLRKREHQATPIDNAHQEQKMGKEGMEHQGAEN